MRGRNSQPDRVSRSVGLLISMLVRYPELSTINFDPRRQTIRFNFLLTGILALDEFERLRTRLVQSLEVYGFLENRPMEHFDLQRDSHGDVTVLEITRDMGSLTQEEISMTIEILRQDYGPRLVVDYNESLLEEEAMMQEELIEEMLEELKESRGGKNLIAFREEGRVMVFNK